MATVSTVVATSAAKQFNTNSGKTGITFYADHAGENVSCTLWGGSYGPTEGLVAVGDKVSGKLVHKGDFQGKQKYWMTPTAIERASNGVAMVGTELPPAPPSKPPASSAGSRVMSLEQLSTFLGTCMHKAKVIVDHLYPDATQDARLQSAEKIAVSFMMAWEYGHVAIKTEKEEQEVALTGMMNSIVEDMKSKGAL